MQRRFIFETQRVRATLIVMASSNDRQHLFRSQYEISTHKDLLGCEVARLQDVELERGIRAQKHGAE
ncbi:hypothetical protein [Burkholderia alba]|uniref:hypothetical protein n=1 Tax=Burkholderia alba TaxID=2683677 RepID=UPI002B05296A|nr:hypothetical protein [Burkholderia alba]